MLGVTYLGPLSHFSVKFTESPDEIIIKIVMIIKWMTFESNGNKKKIRSKKQGRYSGILI